MKAQVQPADKTATQVPATQPVHGKQQQVARFTDLRPHTRSLQQVHSLANNSAQVQQLRAFQGIANSSDVIQRYSIQGNYHIASDNAMVVNKADLNKELYADDQHIQEANTALTHKTAGITLARGALTNLNLTGVPNLYRVTPALSNANNPYPGGVKPVAGHAARVELPSECEKGAIAVIGGFLQQDRHPQNAYVYGPTKHASARIANMIAQSNRAGVDKQAWFDKFTLLEGLSDKAVAAHNEFGGPAHEITSEAPFEQVLAHIAQTDAGLGGGAAFQLHLRKQHNKYVTNSTNQESAALLQRIVRFMDKQMADLEHEIMYDIDATYQGHHDSILQQRGLIAQLTPIYEAQHFPKAVINQALQLTAKDDQLAKYFANADAHHPNDYVNNLNFMTTSRMRSFLQEVVQALQANIVRLEQQKQGRVGTGANQNLAADPEIGEAYGMIGGGFNYTDHGRWNWHWANVIMRSGTDNVTMEAHASKKVGHETHNYNWDFKMYGRPGHASSAGKTFHETWRNTGFGSTPVTVVGKTFTTQEEQAKFVEYSLDALNQVNATAAKTGANDLYILLKHFVDCPADAAQQGVLYNAHRVAMQNVVQNQFPAAYVLAKFGDFATLMTVLGQLDAGIADEGDRQIAEMRVAALATKLRKALELLHYWAARYIQLKKKRGVF
jgi:hypothetical protein